MYTWTHYNTYATYSPHHAMHLDPDVSSSYMVQTVVQYHSHTYTHTVSGWLQVSLGHRYTP